MLFFLFLNGIFYVCRVMGVDLGGVGVKVCFFVECSCELDIVL